MFTLNAMLIPNLKKYGIRFRYIGGIYDPMTVIITHKNLDICRVDMNCISYEPYNYNVYWFPSTVKNARCLKRKYLMSQELIDDICKVIHFEINFIGLADCDRIRDAIESIGTHEDSIDALMYCKLVQMFNKASIKDVIFNNPATIVLWADGTKTVVKAENEEFDPEKGLAMAIAKKALGNNYDYYDTFKKYVGRYEKKQKKG